MIEELFIPTDEIDVLLNGTLNIREATVVLRDGMPDPTYPAKYHRYVLLPGEDTTGRSDRIIAVANAVWTPEVIAAFEAMHGQANGGT